MSAGLERFTRHNDGGDGTASRAGADGAFDIIGLIRKLTHVAKQLQGRAVGNKNDQVQVVHKLLL